MLTDLYQLTMNAAYHDNKKDDNATFELFVRKLPKDWGYFIANGIEDAVDYATNTRFTEQDIFYLGQQKLFKPEFLDFLRGFRFNGEIYAVKEGTPVAPNTPIMRVRGKRTQAQLLETMLLNTINFQTMIASKASRVVNAANPASVVEFGLRRAQEMDAALTGARAAYIAGAKSTSNVLAGREYGIPISGTQAHSFVMSFPNELEAFRAYTNTFPENATLLIDTYDTLQGAKNAAIVAKELEAKGKRLGAVRLDSGDLVDLSKKVRQVLDEQGLNYVKIFASNDLNEYKIEEMKNSGARIDGYGVGTEMITAKPTAAIPGVYKLVEDDAGAKIKLSADKITFPGAKQVYRQTDSNNQFTHDVLALEGEPIQGIPLLEEFVSDGKRTRHRANLEEIREYTLGGVARLPEHAKRLIANPYELKASPRLNQLVAELTEKFGGKTK